MIKTFTDTVLSKSPLLTKTSLQPEDERRKQVGGETLSLTRSHRSERPTSPERALQAAGEGEKEMWRGTQKATVKRLIDKDPERDHIDSTRFSDTINAIVN
ncbi:hypothetical protein Tco_0333327 [Tanacetum coccineum]